MRAIGPSFSTSPSRSGGSVSKVYPVSSPTAVEELHDGVGQHQREAVAAQPRDRLGDRGDGVVVMGHRAVPRSAARRQPHPVQPLFRGLDEIEPTLAAVAARHRQREPADLSYRFGDAVEQVGPVVDQPVRPVLAAVSSSARNANTRSRGGTTPARRNCRAVTIIMPTMFFMSTAPRPQT